MILISPEELPQVLTTYGYSAVGALVALESLGIPLPGEAALIAAAVIAGTKHALNIGLVIAAASAGAILGDNLGFWIGRELGYRLLVRYGHYVALTMPRIKLAQYLFLRYGGAVVFFGRFVAALRCLAAFLAGANRMGWPRFLTCNAAGGIVWATIYGLGAYYIGEDMSHLADPIGVAGGILAVIALIVLARFVRRYEIALENQAEAALPGPLQPVHRRKQKYP